LDDVADLQAQLNKKQLKLGEQLTIEKIESK